MVPPPQHKRQGRDLRDRITGGPGSRDRGQGDTYRPGQQQNGSAPSRSDFTFTSNTRGPHFPPAASVDRGARRNRGRGRGGAPGNNARPTMSSGDAVLSYQRGRRDNNSYSRGGNRSHAAHDRALLQARDDGTEHFLGVAAKSKKFRDLAELSDDEEAAMDTDNTDNPGGDDDATQSKSKVARTQPSSRADADSVPKWSNPDPYTVLPPPEETTGKRTDFVKLIRKAKNEVAEQSGTTNAVTANDDFISFGDDDDALRGDESLVSLSARTSRAQPLQGSLNEVAAAGSLASANIRAKRSAEAAGLPHRPEHSEHPRKRKQPADGDDAAVFWQRKPDLDPAPWALREDYGRLRSEPDRMLHNEILDFYDFVAPQAHDNDIRMDLIQRVQSAIGRRSSVFQPHLGSIRCFGSFPVGLYLPTADMDLVYVSDSMNSSGRGVLPDPSVSKMHKIASKLVQHGLSGGDHTIIAHARVPIIKFRDQVTGLPVDISFENMSGVVAQECLGRWKAKHNHPMVCLVALIKQLLLMQGLNEVNTGGLGGFSIICLVVSFLELHEIPESLGQTFLQFLDYYGNTFNISQERIVMEPAGIKRKGQWGIDGRREHPDRLSIQDPNNASNNVSGGSHRAREVFGVFRKAHRALVERMEAIRRDSASELSILEAMLGGDYSSYQDHRELMRHIQRSDDDPGTSSVPIVIHD